MSDDPFFGEVRRRHPDVDIVLLPPEAAAPPAPSPVDPAVLAALPVEHDGKTRDLWVPGRPAPASGRAGRAR